MDSFYGAFRSLKAPVYCIWGLKRQKVFFDRLLRPTHILEMWLTMLLLKSMMNYKSNIDLFLVDFVNPFCKSRD